jgi:hypothetical protein
MSNLSIGESRNEQCKKERSHELRSFLTPSAVSGIICMRNQVFLCLKGELVAFGLSL